MIGINLHEEARVAKGFPALLSFQVLAKGRQNIELVARSRFELIQSLKSAF